MIHLFVNSLAASAGGGLTYIRNVVPQLAAHPGVRTTIAIGPGLRPDFLEFRNIEFLELDAPVGRRFWYEQSVLPGLLQRSGAEVLLSTGNFALRNSPVPQILLSRNSLYTSPEFYRDLLARSEYRMWFETRIRGILAKRSIGWTDITVAPSEAFADDLQRWTGKPIKAIHHGFDREVFFGDSAQLNANVEQQLARTEGALRILFVSHYNYFRNFETLIRALPLVRQLLPGKDVKLLLTCKLQAGENPGAYRPEGAAKLVSDLGLSEALIELGPVPYRQLHQVYRRSSLYISPAYTETFAHPLVEAMASGLPVIASDLGVHREICGNAAVYFPAFSPGDLAHKIAEVVQSPDLAAQLSKRGEQRSTDFSWSRHVEQLVSIAEELLAKRR